MARRHCPDASGASSADALRPVMTAINQAVLLGFGDTQANAANGNAAGLAAQVLALTQGAPDERLAISKAFQFGTSCGVEIGRAHV